MKHQAGLLSILVPVFNEQELIFESLRRAYVAPIPDDLQRELVVVDDGSTDQSEARILDFAAQYPNVRLIKHPTNLGKGAAVRTAAAAAQGEFSIIQDADLEYNPNEYSSVLKPLLGHYADAVVGSRFHVHNERRVLYFWHALGNSWLTSIANMFSNLNLTDVFAGYKAFRTSLLQSIPIRSNGFGFETEILIKLAQRNVRVYEVPISYNGRTYEEGKKVGFGAALASMWASVRFGLTRDIYVESGPEILDVLAGAPRFNAWMASQVTPFMGERVMEVGAGIGNLSVHMMRGKKRYVAADYDQEHLARLRTRFEGRTQFEQIFCDVSDWKYLQHLEGQLDSVVSLNVIEHVEKDREAFHNIQRTLKPGGKAMILVPHDQSIFGTLDEVLGHFRRYSKAELKEKMETAGFQVEQIFEFNRISRPGWWLNACVLKKTTFSRFQIFVFDRLVWLWKLIDKLLPWKAVSVIAIARKP
jgi:glycosyltransferase involved in cell wall biosynthesis